MEELVERLERWLQEDDASRYYTNSPSQEPLSRREIIEIQARITSDTARIERLEAALRKIASCESQHPDDVVSIARAALTQETINGQR